MVQESESASKPTFIHGHFFGAVGVLAGTASNIFCLPLSIQIHDGDGVISDWLGDESASHVVQMLRDGFRAAKYLENCPSVLNRYFLTVPLLKGWRAYSEERPGMFHVITRAKKNCTAYEKLGMYKVKGRRLLHGAAVLIQELFQVDAASFQKACLRIYGEEKEVRFLSRIYLWTGAVSTATVCTCQVYTYT